MIDERILILAVVLVIVIALVCLVTFLRLDEDDDRDMIECLKENEWILWAIAAVILVFLIFLAVRYFWPYISNRGKQKVCKDVTKMKKVWKMVETEVPYTDQECVWVDKVKKQAKKLRGCAQPKTQCTTTTTCETMIPKTTWVKGKTTTSSKTTSRPARQSVARASSAPENTGRYPIANPVTSAPNFMTVPQNLTSNMTNGVLGSIQSL